MKISSAVLLCSAGSAFAFVPQQPAFRTISSLSSTKEKASTEVKVRKTYIYIYINHLADLLSRFHFKPFDVIRDLSCCNTSAVDPFVPGGILNGEFFLTPFQEYLLSLKDSGIRIVQLKSYGKIWRR